MKLIQRIYPFALILTLLSFLGCSKAQNAGIKSGPMLGYSTMKEVLIWVQTTDDAKVLINYWPEGAPEARHETQEYSTNRANAYIAHCIADSVEPGLTYEYAVYIDGREATVSHECTFRTQELWEWRGDAPDFTFGTGSCLYVNEAKYDRPGTPYGAGYDIFQRVDSINPDFFLWLGDNTYLREADWNSRTGIDHRYAHTRALHELQPLLSRTHNYAIWDDHDFGPNNSDRSYHLKEHTLQTFRNYFPGPDYIFETGVTQFVQWADCDFFLLDNRYWRTPNNRSDIENPTVLGDVQIEWLLDALSSSRAPFKFIAMGGQFLSNSANGEHYINVAPQERNYLLQKIHELKIEGVIFLSGDVHYSEMSVLPRDEAYPLHEFTISPLTTGVRGGDKSENTLQDPETATVRRNFAQFEISGGKNERMLQVHCFSTNGSLLWSRSILASDLKY